MIVVHPTIAPERWASIPLSIRLGNVAAEVARAAVARSAGDEQRYHRALERAHDLLGLTVVTVTGSSRRREMARLREAVADVATGGRSYGITFAMIQRVLAPMAILAARERDRGGDSYVR